MSTHLITGFANKEHVKSADMASYNASIMGNGEFVLERGEQLRVQVVSNNKVRIYDGDIMMQGRHIMIDRGTYEEMTHENGAQGYKRIDLIVMTYEKDNITGIENAKVEVIKGTPTEGTPVVPGFATGDILDAGALKNQMPLYKVPFDGIAIGTPVKMFSVVPTMETREKEITDNLQNQFNALNANTDKNFSALSTNITNQFAELESEIEEDIDCDYGVIRRYYPHFSDNSNSESGKPILGSLIPLADGQLVIVKGSVGGHYGTSLSNYIEELPEGIYRVNNILSFVKGDYNVTYYTFGTYTRIGDYTECVGKKVSILEEDMAYEKSEITISLEPENASAGIVASSVVKANYSQFHRTENIGVLTVLLTTNSGVQVDDILLKLPAKAKFYLGTYLCTNGNTPVQVQLLNDELTIKQAVGSVTIGGTLVFFIQE